MKTKMFFACSVLIVLATLLSVSIAQVQDLCKFDPNVPQGPKAPPPAQADPPYFLWTANGPGDQTTISKLPPFLVQHSGLVTWSSANLADSTFANATQRAIKNGGYQTIPLVYVFGECFGGGMIDDLVTAINNNPMSIISAAFFNQKANYPRLFGLQGNGLDFVWPYLSALSSQQNPTAQSVAVQAAKDDPFGWWPNPSPARKGEKLGTETPEYYSQQMGDSILLKRDEGEANRVILWAGQPELVDDEQLGGLIYILVKGLGYKPANIVVYFGAGKYSSDHSQLVLMMEYLGFSKKHLRAANSADFLTNGLAWAFPFRSDDPPQFFFFLAADHGCNNAFLEADWRKVGVGGGPVPREGADQWGNDDLGGPID
jgi:hypothetical protein